MENVFRIVSLCVAAATLIVGCRERGATWQRVELSVPSPSVTNTSDVHAVAWFQSDTAPNSAIIFLHGVGGSDETWVQLNGNAVLRVVLAGHSASGVRPVVVSARGDSLGWPEHMDGTISWPDFLARDLPEFLRARFGAALTPERIAYVGTSAGGAAALTMALSDPAGFRCIAAHSPAIHPSAPAMMPGWARDWEGWGPMYGTPIDTVRWRAANPIALAATQDSAALADLQLYFDVGSEDHLGFATTTAELSEVLGRRGIAHEYHLRSGGHGSAFTGPNLVHSLGFLVRCLAERTHRSGVSD